MALAMGEKGDVMTTRERKIHILEEYAAALRARDEARLHLAHTEAKVEHLTELTRQLTSEED